jgi:hypothetical protein
MMKKEWVVVLLVPGHVVGLDKTRDHLDVAFEIAPAIGTPEYDEYLDTTIKRALLSAAKRVFLLVHPAQRRLVENIAKEITTRLQRKRQVPPCEVLTPLKKEDNKYIFQLPIPEVPHPEMQKLEKLEF